MSLPLTYNSPTYWPVGWVLLDAPVELDSPAFKRVDVDWLVRGEARISWQLQFCDIGPEPISYQLQASETGLSLADDWEDVGSPQTNVSFLTDSSHMPSGQLNRWHYRVKATSANGVTYVSSPAHSYGILSARDWRLAREITRKELLRLRKYVGMGGWLLKRKWRGSDPQPQSAEDLIIDPLTGETLNPDQDTTYDTTKLGGFYEPYPIWFELSPESHYIARDDSLVKGNVSPHEVTGRTLAFPQLMYGDVFVHDGSDRRYMIHAVKHIAELRGVPIIVACQMRLLPYSDIAYEVAVPESIS